MSAPAAFCGQCGQPVGPDDAFCGQCGQPVAAAPIQPTEVSEPAPVNAAATALDPPGVPASLPREPRRRLALGARGAVAVVAVIVVAAILVALNRGRPDTGGTPATTIGQPAQPPAATSARGMPAAQPPAATNARGVPAAQPPRQTAAGAPATAAIGQPTQPPDQKELVSAIAFSGDGQVMGAGTDSGLILLWRTRDGQPVASFRPRARRIDSLAINWGATLVAIGFRPGLVAVWDPQRRAETRMVSLAPTPVAAPAGNPGCLSFQIGDRVLVALDSAYNLVRFLDLASGTQFEPIRLGPRAISSASLSADQRFLAIGDAVAGTVEVLDLILRQSRGVVSGGVGRVHSTAVSPDGWRVAAAQAYSLFSLWEVATRMHVAWFDGPPPVAALAFSPDGRLLASGGENFVVLWDAAAYREIARLDIRIVRTGS